MCILNFSSCKVFNQLIRQYNVTDKHHSIIGFLVDSSCLKPLISIDRKFTFIVFLQRNDSIKMQILKTSDTISRSVAEDIIHSYDEFVKKHQCEKRFSTCGS